MLIRKILAQLAEERSLLLRAARAAHAEATHEQSKADNKYDTRGLEASYLARGQSQKVADVEQAIEEFEKLGTRSFPPEAPIDIGAIVETKSARDHSFYFIAPRSGGMEIQHEKREILVITPQSPLGKQLMGRTQGERLKIEIAGSRQDHHILMVC
ncbi:MAG: transcription elongation factor GreAB [Verrucomicrobia bacterium]|nr:transcription elongation factor GreAB [Verrucomicrobiota bacterium]